MDITLKNPSTLASVTSLADQYDQLAAQEKDIQAMKSTISETIMALLVEEGVKHKQSVGVVLPSGVVKSLSITSRTSKSLSPEKLLMNGVSAEVIDSSYEEKESKPFLTIRTGR